MLRFYARVYVKGFFKLNFDIFFEESVLKESHPILKYLIVRTGGPVYNLQPPFPLPIFHSDNKGPNPVHANSLDFLLL